MFNKFRTSFSRKDKSSLKSSNSDRSAPLSDHPQTNITPSTRRPANPPGIRNPFSHSNEAPPPYQAAPAPAPAPAPSAPAADRRSNAGSRSAAEDPYSFLSQFDTIFLIDDSGSMWGSNWTETAEALKTITPICTAHDKDGIDIYFLNASEHDQKGVKDVARVERIFNQVDPNGNTPTGQRLNKILKTYLDNLKIDKDIKPINIICITDGEPSDDVETPIINAARKLDKMDALPWQIGIQFFQVGNEASATKHLQGLDDNLVQIAGGELRDIVDTVPYKGQGGEGLTGDGILKCVTGAVNKRLDRKKNDDGIHS